MIPIEELVFHEKVQRSEGFDGLLIETALASNPHEILGYVGWLAFDEKRADFHVLHYSNVIFVEPECQGFGIGYHLFSQAIKSIIEDGYMHAIITGTLPNAVPRYQQWIISLQEQGLIKDAYERRINSKVQAFSLHL